VTVGDEDDEALSVLTKQIGMDPKHIVRLPRVENFWDTGQPGPAGPCAEWHYDRGPAYGPEAVGGTVDPGGDRYLEVGNMFGLSCMTNARRSRPAPVSIAFLSSSPSSG